MMTAAGKNQEAVLCLLIAAGSASERRKMKKYVALICILTALSACLPCMHGGQAFAQQPPMPVVPVRHLFDIQDDFNHPSDVAVGAGGRIYVLDGVNSRIKVFDAAGGRLFAFGSRGDAAAQLASPLGLDTDEQGNVYVADSGNRRVQVFSADGKFLSSFGFGDLRGSKPPDPTDIAVDSTNNRCYVIDNDNHRVLAYSLDGSRLIDQWGGIGEKPGEFRFPFLAAMDRHGILYVVDVLNTRVQALNAQGRVMSYIGKWGVDRGQLYRPKGVAVDARNRIYISDSYLGVVQVFERYRKLRGVLGDEAGNLLRLKTPTGLCVDDGVRIYIVEMLLNKVSVYRVVE